jgi:hypothetical protein
LPLALLQLAEQLVQSLLLLELTLELGEFPP